MHGFINYYNWVKRKERDKKSPLDNMELPGIPPTDKELDDVMYLSEDGYY